MKRLAVAAVAALSLLATAPAALADRPGRAGQGARGHDCQWFNGSCGRRVNPGHGVDDERHGRRHQPWRENAWREENRWHEDRWPRENGARITIRIGGDGSRGERWAYRHGYGFGPPPYGCEYRVMNGQLVLVDSQTLQIIAIIGLLAALLN